VVDTPGFGSSDLDESALIDEMMGVLKNTVKSASVVMIVLDGNQVIVIS
jgi:GTPase Era involved in 16S rRNA processing